MRARLTIVLSAALILAGCLGLNPTAPDAPSAFEPVELPVPVHIIPVGMEPGLVTLEGLRPHLPNDRVPVVESVSGSTGTPTFQPVGYTFTYSLHDAPPEFARVLYEFALTTAEPGRPNAWLVEYDSAGQQRICSPCLGAAAVEDAADVLYLDALAVEGWIEENRAAHGLDFGPNAVTVFLFDGEGAGAFPTETYHYWRFNDGHPYSRVPKDESPPVVFPPMGALNRIETPPFHTPKDPISLRAWGGQWNFVWLDLTAAPSAYDIVPRRPAEDWTDPPLWDVRDDLPRLHENLGRNLADLLQIRVGRDPIYPVTPFERFVTPIYVFIEPGALENPQTGLGVDLEKWVPQADIEASLRRLLPWADISAPVEFRMLPGDDPDMFDAIQFAKRYSDPSLVSAGVIKAYVRDAWNAYAPQPSADARPEEEFIIPQFYFYFNGFYTFWGISTAGGWADGDAWGEPWAIFDHFFDLCLRTTTVPCSKATIGFNNITLLPLHEAGHELGLTHTKDSVKVGDDGWLEGHTNWLWDSTYSMMSYRHVYMEFDHWDRMFIAVSHALGYLEEAHRLADGLDEADAGPIADAAAEARALMAQGRYADAVPVAARAAAMARDAAPVAASLGSAVSEATVVALELAVPASRTLVGQPNLGIAGVPNPIDLDQAGASYASVTFDVPADAAWIHLRYRDVAPLNLGTFKQSFALLLGPDGSYRGMLGESFEDETYVTSHWRGAGTHELRVYQFAGTPGLYSVEVGIGTAPS